MTDSRKGSSDLKKKKKKKKKKKMFTKFEEYKAHIKGADKQELST